MSEWNTFEQRLKNVEICGTASRILDGIKYTMQPTYKSKLEGFLTYEIQEMRT